MKGTFRTVVALHVVLLVEWILRSGAFVPSLRTIRQRRFGLQASVEDVTAKFTTHDAFLQKNTEAEIDVIASLEDHRGVVVGPQRVLIYDTTLRGM